MKYDRNYFRMLDDTALIIRARDSGDELALVLADRLAELADVESQLDAMTNERDELDARCEMWKQDAVMAQDQLADIDAYLEAKG